MTPPKFSLDRQTSILAHINIRDERQNGEHNSAADLKIQFVSDSGILSEFHPRLRHALYKLADSTDTIMAVAGEPTVRVFDTLIDKLHLRHNLIGADVVIEFGLGMPNISLDTVDVDSFTVELMDGGTVDLQFRIKSRPTGEQIKRLYEMLGNEITISVTPAIEKQSKLDLPMAASVMSKKSRNLPMTSGSWVETTHMEQAA